MIGRGCYKMVSGCSVNRLVVQNCDRSSLYGLGEVYRYELCLKCDTVPLLLLVILCPTISISVLCCGEIHLYTSMHSQLSIPQKFRLLPSFLPSGAHNTHPIPHWVI